jgi:hypothetical protein
LHHHHQQHHHHHHQQHHHHHHHHHNHHSLFIFIIITICNITITVNTNPTIKNYSELGSETIVSFRCVSYSHTLMSLTNYV